MWDEDDALFDARETATCWNLSCFQLGDGNGKIKNISLQLFTTSLLQTSPATSSNTWRQFRRRRRRCSSCGWLCNRCRFLFLGIPFQRADCYFFRNIFFRLNCQCWFWACCFVTFVVSCSRCFIFICKQCFSKPLVVKLKSFPYRVFRWNFFFFAVNALPLMELPLFAKLSALAASSWELLLLSFRRHYQRSLPSFRELPSKAIPSPRKWILLDDSRLQEVNQPNTRTASNSLTDIVLKGIDDV